MPCQHLMDYRHYCPAAVICIRASLQYTYISAAETQRKNICGHIRTGLINYSDNSKRNGNLPDGHSVRAHLLADDPAKRRRKSRYILHVGSDAVNTLRGKFQAVIFRIVRAHACKILCVSIQNGVYSGSQR